MHCCGTQLPVEMADDALGELRECAMVESAHEPKREH
jgi:hypothetical protein